MGNNKKKTPKNRQTKKLLVFDEKARLEYLTGFRKRKNERRKKAKDEKEEQIKQDRKELKKKRKDLISKSFHYQGKSKQKLPDFDDVLDMNPTVMELPDHTVTITDISQIDMAGHSGLRLGQNEFEESDCNEDARTHLGAESSSKQSTLKRDLKKLKRKEVTLLNKEQPKKKSKRSAHIGHYKEKKSKKKFQIRKEKQKMKKIKH